MSLPVALAGSALGGWFLGGFAHDRVNPRCGEDDETCTDEEAIRRTHVRLAVQLGVAALFFFALTKR